MKRLKDIRLSPKEADALAKLKRRLVREFQVEGMFVYGSAVRGESDEESDMDLLVITREHLSRQERHRITDAVFEENLREGTNFSALVVDSASWERGAASVFPLRDEILAEGVKV
jgi:predicted nucleotidyltransferase